MSAKFQKMHYQNEYSKQCRSWWGGSWWAASSRSMLIPILTIFFATLKIIKALQVSYVWLFQCLLWNLFLCFKYHPYQLLIYSNTVAGYTFYPLSLLYLRWSEFSGNSLSFFVYYYFFLNSNQSRKLSKYLRHNRVSNKITSYCSYARPAVFSILVTVRLYTVMQEACRWLTNEKQRKTDIRLTDQ